MEEAKQELKNLMNELFVEDLKTKADDLTNSISCQFQGAVNTFKRNFDEMVNESIEKIVEPKFSQVTEKYNTLQDQINTTLQQNSEGIDRRLKSIEDNIDRLYKNQDNKLDELGGSLLSSTNSLFQKIYESDNKITTSISEAKGDINRTVQVSKDATISMYDEQSNKTISIFNKGIEQATKEITTLIPEAKAEINETMQGLNQETILIFNDGKQQITKALSDERDEISAVKVEINGKLIELENKIAKEEQTHNKYNLAITLLMILNVSLVMVLLFRN